jgi:hypothetical protein
MSLDGVIELIEAWDFDYIDDEPRDRSPSSSSPPIHVLSTGSLYEANFPLRVPDGASLEGDGKWSTPRVSPTSSMGTETKLTELPTLKGDLLTLGNAIAPDTAAQLARGCTPRTRPSTSVT